MAVVTRYFSTTSAGAGDGTTWDNRAALFSSGNWSTIITGFNFAGSDTLKCFLGPGSYTCGQTLASGLFSNAPNASNVMVIAACDSAGFQWISPDQGWVSCQPQWDNSTMPLIATTTNIATTSLDYCLYYGLRFTASGRNGSICSSVFRGGFEWCQFENSTSNSSAIAVSIGNTNTSRNISAKCTGSSYSHVVDLSGSAVSHDNIRAEGNILATAGNRNGVSCILGGRKSISRLTSVKNPGAGIISNTASGATGFFLFRSVVAENGSDGLLFSGYTSNSDTSKINKCVIVNNSGFGYSQTTTSNFVIISDSRFRNNVNGDISNSQQYHDINNDFSSGNNSDEFVDSSSGDYRIKRISSMYGKGIGAGDEIVRIPRIPNIRGGADQ